MARPQRITQLAEPEPMCDDRVIHVDAVRAARSALPSTDATAGLAGLFAALGDPTRLRIIAALNGRELCVCDIAATVGQSESSVSHQLRHLRAQRLVRVRRDGRMAYYKLDDDHVTELYEWGLEHVAHGNPPTELALA